MLRPISQGVKNSLQEGRATNSISSPRAVIGSDTGSRGSSPCDFAQKTGFSLTFSHVQLTNRRRTQNFEHLFFAQMKGEFNPHFRGFFGTNWDKSARDYDPHWHWKLQKLIVSHELKTLTSGSPSCLISTDAPAFGVKNLNLADSASLTSERLTQTIQFVCCMSPPSGSGGNIGRFFVGLPALFFAQ